MILATLSRDEIFAEVSRTLQVLFELDAQKICLESHLYQDLDLDSIDAVDLVVRLQNVTGQKIKPEEFKGVRTVEDLVNAVEALLKG